jgi:hypothetical protein
MSIRAPLADTPSCCTADFSLIPVRPSLLQRFCPGSLHGIPIANAMEPFRLDLRRHRSPTKSQESSDLSVNLDSRMRCMLRGHGSVSPVSHNHIGCWTWQCFGDQCFGDQARDRFTDSFLFFRLEGPWDLVMRLIGTAHTCVHHSGIPRIQTDVRMLTRYGLIRVSVTLSSGSFSHGFCAIGLIKMSRLRKVCRRSKRFLSLTCRTWSVREGIEILEIVRFGIFVEHSVSSVRLAVICVVFRFIGCISATHSYCAMRA